MQISASGMSPVSSLQLPSRPQEATERGPDRDNDGDEGQGATVSQSLPTPPPGRGEKVDMMA